MKKLFLLLLVIASAALVNPAEAKPIFTGADYSGVYACKGSNSKVGNYEVQATLTLNRSISQGAYGVYDFNTETENSLVYRGQAIANGYKLALTFNLLDGLRAEFSTGIADVKRVSSTRWAYTNHYYEPNSSGGDYGTEYCVMKKPVKIAKKVKSATVKKAVVTE
ncbi:hypothetical protein [Methylotenera sp.]|uniref:hypothetical protein n=1 Tax=Methylotenera sp. TaxID=2051956 RepID=UPI00272F5AAA|nr:hypothetical protein [Methylotenera sp.]MDP1522041.1 hypothetical protein [Methylotenera sp.]MDP2070009.1 hypothetical protein [Methylotenera sp.]MDP3004993.1 hypothetical protein [Methylotenera sp.]